MKYNSILIMFAAVLVFAQASSKNKVKAKVMKTSTGHNVSLSWTASSSSGVTGNNVYRGTTPGGEAYNAPVNGTTLVTGTTYTDTTVAGGNTYYYTVEAVCPACNPTSSVPSNEASAVVPGNQPAPPTGVTASAQ